MISSSRHKLFSLSMLFGLLFAVPLLFGGQLLAEADHGVDSSEVDSHGHSADAEHHEGDAHKAPPLKKDSAFWSIIAFAGFCFAIHKLGIWNWLKTSMAEREQNEGDLIATAENHLAEAQASLNQYRGQLEAMDETVAEILAEPKRDADHTQSEIVATANREAELITSRVKQEIERSRDHSLHDLFDHLAQRVTAAAEAKVKTNLQADDQNRLIDETLSQLTT